LISRHTKEDAISSVRVILWAHLLMHSDLLNSWKEIANYLGRGVRTVQRWEVQLRLPVRRAHMHRRSSVTALRFDIDQWVREAGRSAHGVRVAFADVRASTRETTAVLRINRQEMHALSTRMHDQVKQTYGLIQRACELASKKWSN
jgi:hypothetical protein